MGCDSSYMQQTSWEKEVSDLATFLVHVHKENKHLPRISPEIKENAGKYYADSTKLDEYTALLCGTLRSLSEQDLEKTVYNAKNKTSRDLANWWEKHQEEDDRKEKEEQFEQERKLKKVIDDFKELSRAQQETALKEFCTIYNIA